jgi:hypothetical protein
MKRTANIPVHFNSQGSPHFRTRQAPDKMVPDRQWRPAGENMDKRCVPSRRVGLQPLRSPCCAFPSCQDGAEGARDGLPAHAAGAAPPVPAADGGQTQGRRRRRRRHRAATTCTCTCASARCCRMSCRSTSSTSSRLWGGAKSSSTSARCTRVGTKGEKRL